METYMTWKLLMLCVVVQGYRIVEDIPDCVDGQQKAITYDPRQYIRCVRGTWTLRFCDQGWTFNAVYKSCQVAPMTSPPPVFYPTPPQPQPQPQPSSCDPPDPCPLGMYYPDNCDCYKFYQCDHGSAVLRPCAPGTAFNPKLGVCDYPYKVKLCKTLGQL